MGEGASRVMIRGIPHRIRYGSGLKQEDLGTVGVYCAATFIYIAVAIEHIEHAIESSVALESAIVDPDNDILVRVNSSTAIGIVALECAVVDRQSS